MLYETPVDPHCPDALPDIDGGVAGRPPAILLVRVPLAKPHEPTALTLTVEPPGMDAGKNTVQVFPEGVTTAPATLHDQLYETAPGTAPTEYAAVLPGQG